MARRMSLKPDASFFRKLALGAFGAAAVQTYLNGLGHRIVELERGALDTRLWKDVKRKRVRIPDLVCSACGVRVESRAKTRPELSMSHSPNDAERAWDFGMVDDDLIAFPVCSAREESWTDGGLRGSRSQWSERDSSEWSIQGHINILSVAALRRMSFRTKARKGATEGSEVQALWRAKFAKAPGVLTGVDGTRLHFKEDGRAKLRAYVLRTGMRAAGAIGERFERHQVLAAGSAPQSAEDLRCRGESPAASVRDLLLSRERTLRFAGCRLARIRALRECASKVKELAEDDQEDAYVRLEARVYLCSILGENADRWFGDWAREHPDPQMRLETVVAMADVRTQSSFDVLRWLLQQHEEPVFLRSAAAWALGCHRMVQSAAVLVEAFADADARIKEEALSALTHIGQDAAGAAIGGLSSGAPDVAAGAAEVLRRLGDVPIEDLFSLATIHPPAPWPTWTVAHLPRELVARRIAELQDERPEVHFTVTVLWTFLDSWIAEHWSKRPLP